MNKSYNACHVYSIGVYICNALLLLVFFIPVAPCFADRIATFALPNGMNVEIVEALSNTDESNVKVEQGISHGCVYEIDRLESNKYIKELNVWHEGNKYALPVANPRMYDAWNAVLTREHNAHHSFTGKCFEKDYCIFRGRFSDAAGSYIAEWLILGDNITRTVLSSSFQRGRVDLFDRVDANIHPSILPDN